MQMSKNITKIDQLLTELLEGTLMFGVETRLRGASGAPVIDIFVDGEEGVTIQDCAKLSRSLSRELEEAETFPNGFSLNVSSPGLDRPLTQSRQYVRHIGRKLKIHVRLGKTDEITSLSGELLRLEKEHIVLTDGEKGVHIRFDQIAYAVVVPAW